MKWTSREHILFHSGMTSHLQMGCIQLRLATMVVVIGHIISEMKSIRLGEHGRIFERLLGKHLEQVHQLYQKTRKVNTKHILYLFTYEHVSSVTTVTSTKGNSGSVVSFYANGIAPDYYNSNAGMQVNIGDISINANLAIDDIRISVTTTSGDTSYQSSIRANATELKIDFESAIITKVDEHTLETEKINYSMSGMLLYALYVAATTGDWRGVPATAMRG